MTKLIFAAVLLPLAAAANETPTNAFRHAALPSFGYNSALPVVTGPVTNDPARKAATLAAARPDAARNWYLSRLAATNPPVAAPAEPVRADTLVLPLGQYPVDRGERHFRDPRPMEIVFADEGVCRAVVSRFRRGVIAPTNLPVRIGGHGGEVVGRVEDLFYVPGEGVWARIAVAGFASTTNVAWRISPELFVLHHPAEDEWGHWGEFIIPRHIFGIALTTEPSLPALQRTEVRFGVPDLPYPKNHLPKHP